MMFYFISAVSAKLEEDTASTLLDMIVKLWITIRGFSGANKSLEKYYMYTADEQKNGSKV